MVAMAMYFYASRLTATAAKTPAPFANNTSNSGSSSNTVGKRQAPPTTTTAATGQKQSISSEKVSAGHRSLDR
jgi:hypothetical protein